MTLTAFASSAQLAWLECGYVLFALHGPSALKIEPMAAQVGISKSSFYHHFADLEGFQGQLFELHLQRASIIAAKERQAQSIDPDLVEILLAHRHELLFSRQLRIHRQMPGFAQVLSKADALVGTDFIGLWCKELELRWNAQQLESIFGLALEHFYLQMQPENLDAVWLRAHFESLKQHLLVLHRR